MNTLELYWDDLTPEAQQKMLDFLGGETVTTTSSLSAFWNRRIDPCPMK